MGVEKVERLVVWLGWAGFIIIGWLSSGTGRSPGVWTICESPV
jgi:hypothetical protein